MYSKYKMNHGHKGIPGANSEEISIWVFAEISGKNTAEITKGIPAGISGGIPDENPEDISERISNDIHG